MKKFQGGGGVPRQTTIGGQRHDLAYINPFEADLLRAYGGSGEPGPGGVPAYFSYSMSRNSDGSYSMPSSSQQRAQRAAAGAPSVSPSRSSSSTPTPTRTTPSSSSSESGRERAIRVAATTPSARSEPRAAEDRYTGEDARSRALEVQRRTAERASRDDSATAIAARAEAERKAEQARATEQARAAQEKAIADATARVRAEEQERFRLAEDARIARAREEAREAQRQRTIGIAQSVPNPMQGGLGGLTDLLGMIPGVPMLIDAAKGAVGDLTMAADAGFFTSREEQRRNLQEARNPDGSRKYSDFEIDEYFLITDETAERTGQQAGARPAGDDSMPYTLPAAADPCPEGYRMDSVTNMCVPADDVTGGTPPPVVPGFPDLTRPDPVAVPTVVGSSDYTQMPVTGGVPPLLPGTGALPMPDFSRGFMPTTYGGMPTDIDPFR